MPLPPDPHDDDLPGPYPGGGGDPTAPPPPPPPPPPPGAPLADDVTTRGAPLADDVTPLANAAAALGRDLERSGAMREQGGWSDPEPTAALDDPDHEDVPPEGEPGPRRRGLVLAAAGVVTVAVVAVAALLLIGDDDEPAATDDETAADETTADADDESGDDDGATEADPDATDASGDGSEGGEPDITTGDPVTTDGGSDGGASGGGLTDNSGETPVEAAEAMFTAAIAGDCEGVVARMTPEAYGPNGESAGQAVAECEADADRNQMAGAELRDVSPVSEDGDAAVVSVTLSLGGAPATQEVPLVRGPDGWKVDVAQ